MDVEQGRPRGRSCFLSYQSSIGTTASLVARTHIHIANYTHVIRFPQPIALMARDHDARGTDDLPEHSPQPARTTPPPPSRLFGAPRLAQIAT